MNSLPVHSIDDIRLQRPCYDPARYLPENWTGTVLDILRMKEIPPMDRLWVVTLPGWLERGCKCMYNFTVWCVRHELELRNREADDSLVACAIVEGYANKRVGEEETIVVTPRHGIPFEVPAYFLEVKNLDELIALTLQYGDIVIVHHGSMGFPVIELYNDYRE